MKLAPFASPEAPPEAPPEIATLVAEAEASASVALPLFSPEDLDFDLDPPPGEPEPAEPPLEPSVEHLFTGRPDSHLRISFLDNIVLTFPDWLIEGIVPSRGVTMLFAPSGAGKTWVVDDWAVHVAACRPWQGHPIAGGGVLYIAAEGAYALPERSLNAMQRAGISAEGLPFAVQREAIVFNDPGAHLTLKAEDIRQEFSRRGWPPIALVVVDTYAECLAGSDNEGDVTTEWMRQFRSFLRQISDPAPPAAGILIHHPGHGNQERARGSSALPAGIDCGMCLEPLAPAGGEGSNGNGAPGEALILRCTKMRDGEFFPDIPLALEPGILTVEGEVITDSSGKPRTTRSVVPLEGEITRSPRATPEAKKAAKEAERAAAKAARKAELRERVLAFLAKAGAEGASQRKVRGNVPARAASVVEMLETLERDGLVLLQDDKWYLKP